MYSKKFIDSIKRYVFDVYSMNDDCVINTRTHEGNMELSELLDFMGLRWGSRRLSDTGIDFSEGIDRYTEYDPWDGENMCMKVIDIRRDWCNMYCDTDYFQREGKTIIDYAILTKYTKTIFMIRRSYIPERNLESYCNTIYGSGRKYYLDSNDNIKYIINKHVDGIEFYLDSYEAVLAYKDIISHIKNNK